MYKCAICDSVLSEPYKQSTEFDMLYTCDNHKEYRTYPNTIAIKRDLDIAFDRNIDCDICGEKLTAEEIATIENVDASNTCMKHRLYSRVWQRDSVKGILGYAENTTGLTKEMLDEQCKKSKEQ